MQADRTRPIFLLAPRRLTLLDCAYSEQFKGKCLVAGLLLQEHLGACTGVLQIEQVP